MNTNTFRDYGHQFIDWLADYYEHTDQYPIRPQVEPGDILDRLPLSPPESGESMDAIFGDFRQLIMPGMTHWQHPGWFAYFPANNSPASVLAELLTAGLGAQCMIWQTSPAAEELETRMMDWLRQMLGLPPHMQGVIQDTASTAALCALISAREKATAFASNKEGVRMPLRVYASHEAHSSIEKGVKIAGYGKDNIHYVDTDDRFAMIPSCLEDAIKQDLASGLHPACVIATLGTTSSMAMDPLEDIARICRQYGVWLHIDAAMAGTAAMVPELRGFMKGAEHADSFVFNPHKWMLTNFDCSAYFVKDPATLVQSFEIHPEYLKTAADSKVKNYRDWGVQLGRRFRALKLWFVIRHYGIEGIRNMVRKHVELARTFALWIEADPRFEMLAPQQLSLVCFRYNPGGQTEAQLQQTNQELLNRINASGKVFLTHTSLKGKYCIRLSVGQRNTAMEHVSLAWQLIQDAVKAMPANHLS